MNATITLIPVGHVAPQHARPLGLPSMATLQCDVAEWPQAFLSLQALGRVREVSIDGGWSATRLAIIVDVVEEQYGRKLRTRAYGYTGPMHNNNLSIVDPELRVYFNRLVTTVTGEWATPTGPQSATHVKHDYHLLRRAGDLSFSLRPEDVLAHLATRNLFGQMGCEKPLDLRSTLTPSIKGSPVAREHPATFVRTMGDAIQASYDENAAEFFEDDNERMFNDASTRIFTSVNAGNDFIRALQNQTDWLREGSIAYRELIDLFGPGVTFQEPANQPIAAGNRGGVDDEVAKLITTAISGLMGRHGVESVYLESDLQEHGAVFADKKTFADGPEVEWDDVGDIEELPGFVDEVNATLAAIAKANGFSAIKLSIDINLATVAVVNISIDGLETQRFVYPMYASALTSNLIAETDIELNDLTAFAEMLYTELTTVVAQPIELG